MDVLNFDATNTKIRFEGTMTKGDLLKRARKEGRRNCERDPLEVSPKIGNDSYAHLKVPRF